MARCVLAVFVTIATCLQLILAQTEIPQDNEILKWEPSKEMKTKYPYYLSGYDYEGAPVWIIEFGKWDLKSAAEAGGEITENFDKYVHQYFATLVNSTGDISANQGFFAILDLEGYDITQAKSVPGIQKFLWMAQTFVDAVKGDKTKGGILINVNNFFGNVWKVAGPIIGKYFKTITVFGTNSEAWRPLLLQKIPQDQLPERYGGSKSHKPIKVFG
ncbi:unnamed protein product [Allacma fusca]|uniref:CRAL-TRIO domain-containing protein n=1 Tax=Allacma fusca TaxID=39272 RepID=A0A8J2JUX3_9HEXA|nr:unnamed protein product [Allacma fusca]